MDRKVEEINLHIDSNGIVTGYLLLEKVDSASIPEELKDYWDKYQYNALEIRTSSIRKMDGTAYSEEWNLFYRDNLLVTNISDDLYKRINDAIKEKVEGWKKDNEAHSDFAKNLNLS